MAGGRTERWALLCFGLFSGSCEQDFSAAKRAQEVVSPAPAKAVERPSAPSPSLATAQSPTLASPNWRTPIAEGERSWFCTDSTRALAPDACFWVPEDRTKELLIYFHGIVPPTRSSQNDRLQEVVSAASQRAGVAVLLPRGKKGFAPRANPGWWGWPTGVASFRQRVSEVVAQVRSQRQLLEQKLEHRFEKVYVAGSSSGAYFATLLLLSHELPEAQGFAIVSGGSWVPGMLSATQSESERSQALVYLGAGTGDSVVPAVRHLAQRLSALGWTTKLAVHNVPHGANEVYLDEAFAFWRARPE